MKRLLSPENEAANPSNVIYLSVVLTMVLLTRFAWTPTFLWTDTVNLAYALESFDPLHHQPQPPGYPLFVGLSRLVNYFSPAPEITFWIISTLAASVAVGVLYLLAKQMVSRWVAFAAATLLIVNPVFWFSRLRTPLRPWLAVFSVLVAYCAWRSWNGEKRFVFWGALALGIGIGFRPDLLAYLLPLWAISTWMATRSWKELGKGGLIISGFSMLWFGTVVHAMGGIGSTVRIVAAYLQDQSRQDSILFAESIRTWLRPASRLVVWNLMAVVGWVWAPIIGRRNLSAKGVPWAFLLVWLVPGLAAQLLFHIAAPGHTLFATPVLCLLGAKLTSRMGKYRDAILVAALSINAALFLNFVPMAHAAPPGASVLQKGLVSLRNSIAFGTFETSQDRLRWWEDMTEVSLDELSHLRAPDRPTVVIALDGTEREFDFINWRVVSYYLREQPLWVLMDNQPRDSAGRIRLVRNKDVRDTEQSTITLPHSARVLWIMLPGGRFHRALERFIPVHSGRYILYSDIPGGTGPFEIEGFRFKPE